MKRIVKWLSPKDWIFVLCSVALIVAQVWLDLTMPDYMSKITAIASTGNGTMKEIWSKGGIMLACALGSMGCSTVTGFFVANLAANLSATIRGDVYKKVQSFSAAEINKFSTASLITRASNDVQKIQMFVAMGLQMLVKAPITVVWAITKISSKQWQWSVATAVAVAFMLLSLTLIMSLVVGKFKKLQRLTDDLNQTTRENLTGIRVVRAYNAEDYQMSKFSAVNEDFTKTNLFTGKTMSFIGPVMSAVMNGLSLAIYWIGAAIISKATPMESVVLYSDMVVFMSYGMQVVGSFMMLAMVFMFAPRAYVSAKRINEVLSTPVSLSDGAGVGETQLHGTVEFKGVSFKYPDGAEEVLSDINFKAEQGQTFAFIGATGCGKSTLVNLIPRFYDVSEGSVEVNGHDVREYKKDELNKIISYVSQKAILFSGTIGENIDFGDNGADPQKIERAVEVAQSKEFVDKQENGIQGRVAQNGSNFSGGQKQRLSVARALARDAEIFIFDDTFSALDYITDAKLRQAIKEEKRDATFLIVAQRVGTIMNADKILVLADGKIVGSGTHEYLLENCPEYIEIVKSQLKDEELKTR